MSWKDYVSDDDLKKRIQTEEKAEEEKRYRFENKVNQRANEIINKLNDTNGFEIWGNIAKKAEQAIDSGYTERQNQEYEKDRAERETKQQQRIKDAEGKGLLAKAGARVQNWGENILQKPKALYDDDGKFTFGDILRAKGNADRAAVDTLLGAGTHAIGAIADMGKSGTAIAGYGTSAIARATGNDEFANEVQESTTQSLQDMEQFKNEFTSILDEESALGKSGNAMAESMAFSGTLGVSGKKIGNALLLASGLGNSLEESYSREDLEDWQRWLQGAGSAYIGYFTEQIGDAFGFGGNGLTNTVKSAVMNKLESGTAKFLARLGLNGAFEASEETVEPILNAGLNWTMNLITDLVGHGGKFDTSVDIGDVIESSLSAFVTGMAGSSNENSQGIDVDKAVNQMAKEMRSKGYDVTKADMRHFKEVALTFRENAIAEDYKYANREEKIDESNLSDNQKAQLLEAVRAEDISSKDLKEQIKNVENTNKEVEKKLDEYNVPEDQKQTLLQMTRESTDNSDMNEIVDQVINDNRKMDAEINKQIQQIDDGKITLEELVNRNQRLLAEQKKDLIERYNNGDITDYEALREVRDMEAETAQNRIIRDEANRKAGDQQIINDLNTNSTLGRLTYDNRRENAVNFEKDTQIQLPTIENKPLLETKQQTTQEEPQKAETQISPETEEKVNNILKNNKYVSEESLDRTIKYSEENINEMQTQLENVETEEDAQLIQDKIELEQKVLDKAQNVKNEINKLRGITTEETTIQEKPKDIGVHYGDLGKGEDTVYKSQKDNQGRNITGGFGTGTYFFSEEASNNISENEKVHVKGRPKNTIDLSDYNLYKPESNEQANKLYNALQALNNFETKKISQGEISFLNKFLKRLKEDYRKGKLDTKEITDYFDQNNIEYEGKNSDLRDSEYQENLLDTLEQKIEFKEAQNNRVDESINSLKELFVDNGMISEEEFEGVLQKAKEDLEKNGNNDSLSTLFMKALGYEGIDVRGLDKFDNYEYGSVVYDLKNNENKTQAKELPQAKLPEANTTVNENALPQTNGVVARAYNEPTNEFTRDFQRDMEENLLNDTKQKNRGYPETVINGYVDKKAKQVAREVLKTEQYTPISNNQTIDKATERINNNGADNEYTTFVTKFNNNERMTLQDIATAELLIQHYSYLGDKGKLEELIKDVSIVGTELGQMVQALSIIKKQTPAFQLKVAEKIAERLGKKYKVEDLSLSDEIKNKIKNSSMENIENVMSEAYEEIANQLPPTFLERVDNWRYLAMLGNPKTHFRNILGNVAMHGLANIKNELSGIMQSIYGANTKNKNYIQNNSYKIGILNNTQAYKDFIKEEIANFGDKIDSFGNKYKDTPNSEVEKNRKKFNNLVLNKLAEFNMNALDVEDQVFIKWAYRDAIRDYLIANNINVEALKVKVDDSPQVKAQKEKNLNKLREYGVQQALEATFHQANTLATVLNDTTSKLRQGSWIARRGADLLDTIIPFKKTPANILATGFDYSPAGLLKGLGSTFIGSKAELKELDSKLAKGTITEEEYGAKTSKIINDNIDQLAKGTTGTALATIGFFLAQAGLVKAGNDDEEDQFEENLGKQKYSINWNGHSVSLDWLSPSAMPFFMGSEFYNFIKDDEKELKLSALIHAMSSAFNPAFETTMLNNVTSALTSYSQDAEGRWENVFLNAIQNYESQLIPSAITNIYKTVNPDTTIRTTASTKQDVVDKTLDAMWNQTKSRLPIAETYRLLDNTARDFGFDGFGEKADEAFAKLPEKVNKYGETQHRESSLLERAISNFINPATIKDTSEVDSKTTQEITRLNQATDVNTLPSSMDKYFKYDNNTYRMNNAQYAQAQKTYGEEYKDTLDVLFNESAYNSFGDTQKANFVKEIKSYATECAKVQHLREIGVDYDSSNEMYNSIRAVEMAGGNKEDYINFHLNTKGMEKADKIQYLENMNVNDDVKKAIYENDIGTYNYQSIGKDENYNAIKAFTGGNVSNDYLEYKRKLDAGEFSANGEKNGKKKRVMEFVNNSGMSNLERFYIYTNEGYEKELSKDQRQRLYDALKENKDSMDEEKYNTMIGKLIKAGIYRE